MYLRRMGTVQVKDMREEAAAEATKVDKDNGGKDDKVNNKQTKLKPR